MSVDRIDRDGMFCNARSAVGAGYKAKIISAYLPANDDCCLNCLRRLCQIVVCTAYDNWYVISDDPRAGNWSLDGQR